MRLLCLTFLLFSFQSLFAQDTFSIVAYDSETGEVGSAGASCLDNVQFPGSNGAFIISDVIPGRGAIHTQSFYIEANQNAARNRLMMGDNASEIITWLTRNDAEFRPAVRQYGIVTVDAEGNVDAAAYTGEECFDWKGQRVNSSKYAIQGNILLGEEIVNNMEIAFNRTEGTLADKLMAVMQAANVPGADSRCLDEGVSSLSAFLRVAKPTDSADDLYLDLNVPGTPFGVEPIDELQNLYDEFLLTNTEELAALDWQIYPNPVKDELQIKLPVAASQLTIFDALGRVVEQLPMESTEVLLSTQNWDNGLYFLQITNAQQQSGYRRVLKVE
ncbi:MAG: DUF1028 domain-containing protein [Saprospiraceae bacterium]